MGTSQFHFAELALAEQRNLTGLLLVGHNGQVVTGFRGSIQAKDLDRNRRAGFLHWLAVLVEHRTNATEVDATQDHVALTQGTVLNQHGGYRTAALVQARLDHHTATRRRRRCLELEELGLQQNGFEQFVYAGTHLRGDRNERRVAAPLFRNYIERTQAVLDVVRVGIRLVDLVHRNHDRYTGSLGVLDGFLRLWHHAVIRCDHQDHDIGRLGTTSTHGGKRRVTRGIEEGDHATLGFDVISADVLGDTAGFADCNLGAADVVEQRGLAMVDVAHHGHDRCTRYRLAFELKQLGQLLFQSVVADQLDLVPQLFCNQLSSFLIQHLVDGDRRTHLEHELDDFGRFDRHLLGQLGHGDGFADRHFAHYRSCWALEPMLITLLELGLAATAATETIGLVFTGTYGTRQRSLGLERRTMLRMLAITTLVVITAWLLDTTRLFLLTLRRRSYRLDRNRCRFGAHRRLNSCWRRGLALRLDRLSLTACFFFGTLARVLLGLQASSLFSRALLLGFATLFGFDFLGAALDEGLLLAHFNADGLATANLEFGSGLALQGDLARLVHFRPVAAFQMGQQGLFFVIGHYLLGAGVRQSCLTHLLKQSLDRCGDHLGQFFHRDLRHAFLSSGR